jgi:hypothetical protein
MFGRVQSGRAFLDKSSNYFLLTVMDFQGPTALLLLLRA